MNLMNSLYPQYPLEDVILKKLSTGSTAYSLSDTHWDKAIKYDMAVGEI